MKIYEIALAAALCVAGLATQAQATPITYDLTLNGSPISGTGAFTLASTPVASGVSTYTTSTGLSDLSFNIGSDNFTLAEFPAASVTFVNGLFNAVSYSYAFPTVGGVRGDVLHTSGVFAFYYNNQLSESAGTFSATVAPTPVPEPLTISLFGVALAGLGFAKRRQVRKTA